MVARSLGTAMTGDVPRVCVWSVGTGKKWPVLFPGIREDLGQKGTSELSL